MLDTSYRCQRALLKAIRRITMRVRREYYVMQPTWTALVALSPRRLRDAVGLADDGARRDHRLELGAGPYPQAGFVHFDTDWTGRHLEGVCPAWDLPLPDGWARELVAVHMFEHIHPSRVRQTLDEWRRVLAPGGIVQIHVPNAPGLMERFLAVEPREKWKFAQALLGMYGGPNITTPEQVKHPADHQLLLDWPLVESLLRDAGFLDVQDLSASVRDRHTEGWSEVIGQFSLVVTACNPAAAD